ncbi:MAG: glucuronyl hydrolase [Caulobacter sp.]|nr:glucuronyl hydrolase [Caulobacter sp.]
MRASLILAMAATLLAGGGAIAAPAPAAAPPARAAEVLPLARQVADWQLAHMGGFDYVGTFKDNTAKPRGWIQGAFFLGLTAFADRTGEPRYAQAILDHGRAQAWRLGDRPMHADDHVIGQTWLWADGRTRDPATIAPLKARFDAILANPPHADLAFADLPGGGEPACQTRWCWSDALFMAPATWTGLSRATGDPRYAAYGDREFWAATDYLYDPADHLFYRDSRFFERRDAQGRKIFWSRGNGWVYGGLVNILKSLPADHPSRPRYVAMFRQMSAKLVTLQKADGYWPASLLAPEHSPPETSGTGFFVYGLAYGLNSGLLDNATYRPAVDRGWAALAAAVHPDGKLGWVQQVGYAPDQVAYADTQLYGVGAFLLAASELSAPPKRR